MAPFYYKLSQDGVCAYFAEIARESPIDLTLYNIPQFANALGGMAIKITGSKAGALRQALERISFHGGSTSGTRPLRSRVLLDGQG